MQLTGGQFTTTSALFGNDFATFPDFPAEIRAPRGTTFGVSGFQVHFADHHIHTPGDAVNAMDNDSKTPLDWALEKNHAEFAAVLRDELGGKRAADL